MVSVKERALFREFLRIRVKGIAGRFILLYSIENIVSHESSKSGGLSKEIPVTYLFRPYICLCSYADVFIWVAGLPEPHESLQQINGANNILYRVVLPITDLYFE